MGRGVGPVLPLGREMSKHSPWDPGMPSGTQLLQLWAGLTRKQLALCWRPNRELSADTPLCTVTLGVCVACASQSEGFRGDRERWGHHRYCVGCLC